MYISIPTLSIHCTNINSIYGLSPNINWKKFGMKIKLIKLKARLNEPLYLFKLVPN